MRRWACSPGPNWTECGTEPRRGTILRRRTNFAASISATGTGACETARGKAAPNTRRREWRVGARGRHLRVRSGRGCVPRPDTGTDVDPDTRTDIRPDTRPDTGTDVQSGHRGSDRADADSARTHLALGPGNADPTRTHPTLDPGHADPTRTHPTLDPGHADPTRDRRSGTVVAGTRARAGFAGTRSTHDHAGPARRHAPGRSVRSDAGGSTAGGPGIGGRYHTRGCNRHHARCSSRPTRCSSR